MELLTEPKTVREILPSKFLPNLAKACGTDRGYLSGIITDEKFTSKHWPHIERLAMETDAAAYKARIAFLKSRILEKGKENIKSKKYNQAA